MTDGDATVTNEPTRALRGPFDHRQVFLSHAHSDGELARALQALVSTAYSGLVDVFTTADASPSGGLQPGDEWYRRIHEELNKSESVWVLATKTSIARPWIYWEAGIGRALRREGPTVVRVGLGTNEVPQPLSALQSFDGLSTGQNGIDKMLAKIGDQIGMSIDLATLETPVRRWVEYANNHKPDEASSDEQSVVPEQVDRIEHAIRRLERLERSEMRNHALSWMAEWTGIMFSSLQELNHMVIRAPQNIVFRFDGFDMDGDAMLSAQGISGRPQAYLQSGAWAEEISEIHPKLRRLIDTIRVADIEQNSGIAPDDDLPF